MDPTVKPVDDGLVSKFDAPTPQDTRPKSPYLSLVPSPNPSPQPLPMNSKRAQHRVQKRDGTYQPISFDKVTNRLRALCDDPALPPIPEADYIRIAQHTIKGIYDGIPTSELDQIAARAAQPLNIEHPDYDILATRIAVSNYHKNGVYRLWEQYLRHQPIGTVEGHLLRWTYQALYDNVDSTRTQSPLVSPLVYALIQRHHALFESWMHYERDYQYDFTGWKLLEESYLCACSSRTADGAIIVSEGEIVRAPLERPQHLMLRVALGIHTPGPYVDDRTGRTDWLAVHRDLAGLPGFEDLPALGAELSAQHAYLDALESHEQRQRVLRIIREHTHTWDDMARLRPTDLTPQQLGDIRATYEALSQRLFTHATPTLFSAGTLRPQLSSCYLTRVADSSHGISHFWANCVEISKYAGGIGSSVSNIRALGAYIRGTNGVSNGLLPMLRVVNDVSIYIDQGGNKRPGTHAVWIEPWHGDVLAVIAAKRPRGNELERARNLFYGMWICDEFMRTVDHEMMLAARGAPESHWYLMSPDVCPGLMQSYDEDLFTEWLTDEALAAHPEWRLNFTRLYRQYIREGKYLRSVAATEIWSEIFTTINEAGVPYMSFKDASNRKSGQKNLGTITGSNLCTEIVEYHDVRETAVCNLASISLAAYITDTVDEDGVDPIYRTGWETDLATLLGRPGATPRRRYFAWGHFRATVKQMVRNLNRVIDVEYYPIPESRASNLRHRPIGLGVQGLADLFSALRLPYDSPEALELDHRIMENMYFAALEASCELAERDGAYASYRGSPASQGQLQFDLWEAEEAQLLRHNPGAPVRQHWARTLHWEGLKARIAQHGLRNSLLVAPMPTASTSTLMGNSPCTEPHNGLVYKRRNRAGEFTLVNGAMQRDLIGLGLWTEGVRNALMSSRTGSIAKILSIPQLVRDIYKVCWDMRPSAIMNHYLARATYVDQAQSMNLFVEKLDVDTFTKSMWFGFRRGFKNGVYYFRQLAGADANKISVKEQTKEASGNVTIASAVVVEGPACAPGCTNCEA
jgi:ribonucleoside-diphosphate reductase alpha subunit